MRTILDSIATRLDESRDISRYLIGLLVFLGLLGTFWGLLGTIGSIGEHHPRLSTPARATPPHARLPEAGLSAPLAGMGTAFSSSLFGLSGSLVLGFLDLQAGRAQTRFYTELENWLSSVTDLSSDIAVADPAEPRQLVPTNPRCSSERLRERCRRMAAVQPSASPPPWPTSPTAFPGLVKNMRTEQQMHARLGRGPVGRAARDAQRRWKRSPTH